MDSNDEELNSYEENCLSKIYESDEDESASDEECQFEFKCPECGNYFESRDTFLKHLDSYEGTVTSCVDCHKVFQNESVFKAHKQLNVCSRAAKEFKCKLCSKTIHGESQYTVHLRGHKRNRCPTCGQHFSRLVELEAHALKEHGSVFKDLYRCHLCARTFVQRRTLVSHYQLAHPNAAIVCPVCLELFDSDDQLNEHKKSHKLQEFTCEKCGQRFTRRQQFLTHVKEHDKYKCETCEEGFSSKKVAARHALIMDHIVVGVVPRVQCDQCGEMLQSMKSLQEHQAAAHGKDVFACGKCKMTFKNKRNYQSHLQTEGHLRGEEPKAILPCGQCDKTFVNLNNLRSHVTKMHGNLKEKSCDFCPYKTKIANNLKRHLALHTDKPKFVCDKCGDKMQTKSALQEHISRSHEDGRNFSCEKCGTRFAKSSDLNRHLVNIHSETAPHACDCGKRYRSLSNLKRHQVKVHAGAETKVSRLAKLYPVDPKPRDATKKKKKNKKNPKTDETDLLLDHFDDIAQGLSPSTDELLQVVSSYEIDGDKNAAVYSQGLDINGLHVVESMILDGDADPTKQSDAVLINVRNLFGNEFVLPHTTEQALIQQHGIVEPQTSGMADFMPHDLNFLNVKVDWASTAPNAENHL